LSQTRNGAKDETKPDCDDTWGFGVLASLAGQAWREKPHGEDLSQSLPPGLRPGPLLLGIVRIHARTQAYAGIAQSTGPLLTGSEEVNGL
jgi:hypothetical protein